MSTRIDKLVAVKITNTTVSPYLIEKNTQIAEFNVVTPEQSKHNKPGDMAILSMIPQGEHGLTAKLNNFFQNERSRAAKQNILVPAT